MYNTCTRSNFKINTIEGENNQIIPEIITINKYSKVRFYLSTLVFLFRKNRLSTRTEISQILVLLDYILIRGCQFFFFSKMWKTAQSPSRSFSKKGRSNFQEIIIIINNQTIDYCYFVNNRSSILYFNNCYGERGVCLHRPFSIGMRLPGSAVGKYPLGRFTYFGVVSRC